MTNLRQLIETSSSIIVLGNSLNARFPDLQTFLKWLENNWHELVKYEIYELLQKPLEEKIPTLNVEVDGITYRIHGIVHGFPIYLVPGWHPRKQVVKYISEAAASFHRPDEGEDYLYEENLHLLFGFLKSQEIKDQTYASQRPNSSLLYICLCVSKYLSRFFILPFALTLYFYLHVATDRDLDLHLIQMALKDVRYQSKFADLYLLKELPQPLELEKTYLQQKSSRELLIRTLLLGRLASTDPERSLIVARELEAYAKRHNLRTLHYFGGVAHMTEIAYFLQNPNYSFDYLEKYI